MLILPLVLTVVKSLMLLVLVLKEQFLVLQAVFARGKQLSHNNSHERGRERQVEVGGGPEVEAGAREVAGWEFSKDGQDLGRGSECGGTAAKGRSTEAANGEDDGTRRRPDWAHGF